MMLVADSVCHYLWNLYTLHGTAEVGLHRMMQYILHIWLTLYIVNTLLSKWHAQ